MSDWLLIVNKYFFKPKCPTFSGSSFSKMKNYCSSLFTNLENWISFDFGLLGGLNKQWISLFSLACERVACFIVCNCKDFWLEWTLSWRDHVLPNFTQNLGQICCVLMHLCLLHLFFISFILYTPVSILGLAVQVYPMNRKHWMEFASYSLFAKTW